MYPLRGDYDIVVQHLHRFVNDDVLKKGKPLRQKNNSIWLKSYNGGKAIVYEIEVGSTKYALKCWVEDLGDLKLRYKEIHDYLAKTKLEYFVDFHFKEDGIFVNNARFPIVRMEWVEGTSFKNYIKSNLSTPKNIFDLATQFLKMVKDLHINEISHGDLQHGNILINKFGKIVLIDYDSLYVPNLKNEIDNIKGLQGYQHPSRQNLKKLNAKSDFFSEIVIYISLLILAHNPNYWKRIEDEERLFFSNDDFKWPQKSPIFREFKKLSPEIQNLVEELEYACNESNIENLQPLEKILDKKSFGDFDFTNLVSSSPSIQNTPDITIPDFQNFDFDIKLVQPKIDIFESKFNKDSVWNKLDSSKNVLDKSPQPATSDNHKFDEVFHPPSTDNWNIFWNQFTTKFNDFGNKVWNKIEKWFE